MSVLPGITGFWAGVGPGLPPVAPRLAAAGEAVVLHAEVAGASLEGVGVAPAPGGARALACDGDLAVLIAGELYHREALGTAVGPGAGHDDASLLLAAFRRYGPAAFRLVDGRFAAVVLHGDQVVLATDHAASVPLYARLGRRQVWVATEAKALAGLDGAGPTDVLHGAGLPGAEQVLGAQRVYRVRAGTAVAIEVPRPRGPLEARAACTWRPPAGRALLAPDRAVAAVRACLGTAVRTRLRGDRATVVLSGGIDSSAVAAMASPATRALQSVTLGTDAGDEFATARAVAGHLGLEHQELEVPAEQLVGELPFAVAAAEIVDADVLEYLLPLVALYRRLPGPPRRILTGYGADIPLGGMHRQVTSLGRLDAAIAEDMASFDGLNELSPLLSGIAGHWTTHPYWDRALLDLLTGLEPGLKRREGLDKWVLRTAMADRLPAAARQRPKLGIHEGSGLTSTWTGLLRQAGVASGDVAVVKRRVARRVYDAVVLRGVPAEQVEIGTLLGAVPA